MASDCDVFLQLKHKLICFLWRCVLSQICPPSLQSQDEPEEELKDEQKEEQKEESLEQWFWMIEQG